MKLQNSLDLESPEAEETGPNHWAAGILEDSEKD